MTNLPKLPPEFDLMSTNRRRLNPVVIRWETAPDTANVELVYIACPWKLLTEDQGGVERALKREYAQALAHWAILQGLDPFVPVLHAEALGLKDEIPEQRQMGMRISNAILILIGDLIVGVDGGFTSGMSDEVKVAWSQGSRVWWVSLPGWAQTFRQQGYVIDWEV